MSDHRDALAQIMRVCAGSQQYTRRTQQIHDIAMRALGMTLNQRAERHERAAARSQDMLAVARVAGWRKAQEKFAARMAHEEEKEG